MDELSPKYNKCLKGNITYSKNYNRNIINNYKY